MTWTRIGGLAENPGCYDTFDGALVWVSRRDDGVIRRCRESYCGRGGDWTRYTCDRRDIGGPRAPDGVREFATAAAARRAAREMSK